MLGAGGSIRYLIPGHALKRPGRPAEVLPFARVSPDGTRPGI
jgi:hypothetical protein